MSKSLKIVYQGVIKKTSKIPSSFDELVNYVLPWTSIDVSTYTVSFREDKTNFEITDENSYSLFINRMEKTAKLTVEASPKGFDPLNEEILKQNLEENKPGSNAGTKSDIYAPYNSSSSSNNFDELNKENIKIENEALQFNDQTKEANFNYEKNNNSNVDNGYILPQEEEKKEIFIPRQQTEEENLPKEEIHFKAKNPFNEQNLPFKEQNPPFKEENPPKEENLPKAEEEEISAEVNSFLNDYLDKKLNDIQENIINQVTQTIISKSQASKIQNISQMENNSGIIHKGIQCSNCHSQNIKGPRFKCLVCENYNLCEVCEKLGVHDIYHILLKINYPIEESLINEMNLKEYKYSVENFNYLLPQDTFRITKQNNPSGSVYMDLVNNGKEDFDKGFQFMIVDDSKIKAENVRLIRKTTPNANIKIEVKFDINDLTPGTYESYWQMRNSQGVYFGKVSKITIILE